MTLISFGRWYYDHASTRLPALTHEDGRRSDWGKVEIALEEGETVTIRPATPMEREGMALWFDEMVDKLAVEGFVHGIGNFDKDNPPPGVAERVAWLKEEARKQ